MRPAKCGALGAHHPCSQCAPSGTLTPIVDQPDRAFMSPDMRAAVKAVASHFPAAIISGRALDKVTSFVQLAELYYAGSHGFDIMGPRCSDSEGSPLAHQPVPWAVGLIDEAYDALLPYVAAIEGASVEHNKFCVSVHYRLCPNRRPEVEAAIAKVLEGREQLTVTSGRKVYEVRPKVEWDKGRALLYLLQTLGLDGTGGNTGGNDVCSLYLGDDVSDEDAFRALADRGLGIGILVASRAKPTAARYTLSSPEEVQRFLWKLVGLGIERADAAELAAADSARAC